jgi:Holliday junction resolvase RusA-like endonuclease
VIPPTLTLTSRLRPVPKGSLEHIGRGNLRESNPMTKPTMDNLTLQLNAARARHPQRDQFPLDLSSGIEVEAHYYFLRPAWAEPGDRPTRTDTGDVDKLTRLVLDALTKSRVIRDDTQVVDVLARAWFAAAAGYAIRVGPARDNDGNRVDIAP